MATRERIEFDFRNAMAQADRIDELADSLSRLSRNKFGDSMQNLAVCWKGENASLYLSKGSRLQGKMNGTAGQLHTVAADIRTIARRMYAVEMAALSIASARTY